MKPQKPIPPKLADQFLCWFCRGELLEEILGDLHEYFEELPDKPNWKRNLIYWFHVVNFLRPFAIRKSRPGNADHIAIFKLTFLLSFRSFKRYKSSFFINLIGLSTGLASTLLIYLWVSDELSMDKFHENDNQLYTVLSNYELADGAIETSYYSSDPLAGALREEIPEVEYAVAVNSFTGDHGGTGVVSYDNNHIKAKGIMAGKDYFHVFSYHLIRGNRSLVLADKNGIVISEDFARKLFNTTEGIIGKTLAWNHKNFEGSFYITGIFKRPPVNSTQQFDIVFNFDLLRNADRYAGTWNSNLATTHLVLKKDTHIDQFNKKIADFSKPKHPSNENTTLFVQQYSKRYLYGQYQDGVQTGGRIQYVKLFSVIALFILIIACINFMNLSTAQASGKMKEIGVKKAMGANRTSLVIQFLGESVLMTFLSLILAIGLVLLVLPQFNAITGKYLDLAIGIDDCLYIFGWVLVMGLIAGSYPAFYLSAFKPVAVLKGKLNKSFGELWVRQGLVILQFTLSSIFIVSVLVINRQIEYVQTKNLGFDRDNVISFLREGRHEYDPEVFLSALKNIPGVVHVANMPGSILDGIGSQSGYSWRGLESDRDVIFKAPRIGYGVIETLDMAIVEGRSFSRNYKDDDYSKIILNESAVKLMGLEAPIGTIIKHGPQEQEVIGVVKDFQYGSLHNKVEPLIFRFRNTRFARNIMVRIQTGTEKATLGQIEDVYRKFHPVFPFEFTFLDDDYQQLYKAEMIVGDLSHYFAGIAIVVSCLGLFGLVAFSAGRRTKEIGIRKILGATVFGIVRMLSGDFTKMVFLAIVVASPISYLIVEKWLERFAYRIELEWWLFASAGLLALFIAWAVVCWQTIKAAKVNPVECLRDE